MMTSGNVASRRVPRGPLVLVMLGAMLLLLSSCAADPNPVVGTGEDPAGFWLGLRKYDPVPESRPVSGWDSGTGSSFRSLS